MAKPATFLADEDFIRPRPGVAQALGVLNLIIATTLALYLLASGFWVFLASRATPPPTTPPATRPAAGTPFVAGMTAGSVSMFGMNDPTFVRFVVADCVSALILNGLMFASGLGLVNLRRWGARLWAPVAWAKILRLILAWGIYILVVAPSISIRMAQVLLSSASFPPGRGPKVADLTRIYGIFNLIMAVGMIVLGSIYPAVSLWVIGRPGVRAALVRASKREGEPT